MKKLLYFALLALMAIGISSCHHENEPTPKNTMTFSPERLSFPGSGGTIKVDVTASADWEITKSPDWIYSIRIREGQKGTTTMTVTVPSGEDARGEIVFRIGENSFRLPVERIKKEGFSVSATKRVVFAPGNLQYKADLKTWRFAPNQYDIVGLKNENIAPNYDGWIDLFGWGTGANPTMISENNSDYKAFARGDDGTLSWRPECDFFNHSIHNGETTDPAGTWRLLDPVEWTYLLHGRAYAADHKYLAIVNGIPGLILLPDEWPSIRGITLTKQDDMTWKDYDADVVAPGLERYGLGYYHGDDIDHYSQNKITASDWERMEANGAVFLPAAGWRYGNTFQNDGLGVYMTPWFSTYSSHVPMNFDKKSIKTTEFYAVSRGLSVRGVKDVK